MGRRPARKPEKLFDRLPVRLRRPNMESEIRAKAAQFNGWHKYASYVAFCDWQWAASEALGPSTTRTYDLAAENGIGYWAWLAAGERLDSTKTSGD